ncbi:MAG: PaaI family thioesterase [Candidatus Saccharibacteria bacterium]
MKRIPSVPKTNCFGCSQTNNIGLQMQFYTDESAVYSWLNIPNHFCGWDRVVHGGIQTTILDEIMSWSAIYLLHRFILTTSMNIELLKPVFTGIDLVACGQIKERIDERHAIMEGSILDMEGNVCTRSMGHFKLYTYDALPKSEIFTEELKNQYRAACDIE